MTRSLSIWGTSVLVLLFLGFAGKTYYPAKPPAQLAMQAASKVAAGHTLSDEVATGDVEDPDRVSLVGPLAVWMRQDEAPDVHKKGHVQWTAQPMDHITVRDQMPEKYLRARFRLNKSAQFRFVIPPHTVNSKLHGSFRSFLKYAGSASDRPEAVTICLLDSQQFDDFIHGRAMEPSFEFQSSKQNIDFALPGVHDEQQEYHLIFSSNASRANLFVEADFVVEAE